MSPTVSVAMGVYNGAPFLREQVRSIVEQTVPVAELVVGDDGSVDGSLDAIRAELELAGSAAPALVVLPAGPAPLGVTGNFERILLATTGDAIALADQDDRWRPDRVAIGLESLADERVLLAHADGQLIDAAGAPLGSTLFGSIRLRDEEVALVDEDRALEVLVRRNIVTGAATMIRPGLVRAATPFPREWVHDEWLAMLAAATGRMATSRRIAIDYRLHGANQIGVPRPTLRYRLGRMVEPRGDRLVRIHATMTILHDRLRAMGADHGAIELVRRKVAFESARIAYPAARPARPRAVFANRAGYPSFSSQGRVDLLRDVVQPA